MLQPLKRSAALLRACERARHLLTVRHLFRLEFGERLPLGPRLATGGASPRQGMVAAGRLVPAQHILQRVRNLNDAEGQAIDSRRLSHGTLGGGDGGGHTA